MGWYPIALSVVMSMTLAPGHFRVARNFPAVAPWAQGGSADQQPLARDEIKDLVDAGMDSAVLARKVEKLGINFEPTDDYLQSLTRAGATDVLIQALRSANPKPLSKDQVLKLVAGGVASSRAAALVKQHGIDFLPDDRFVHTLRIAGADDVLVDAVRAASRAVAGDLVVETSPGATVYLDGEVQGHTDAKGALEARPKLGVHTVRISLAGKQDFQQSVTLGSHDITRIEAPLQDAAATAGTTRVNSRDGLTYVWIPAGTFAMGCSPGDINCADDEKPVHNVTVTNGFWIGQTEITVGAYKRFAAALGTALPPDPIFNSRKLNPGMSDLAMPIIGITWASAQNYCGWAGGRLPTEAEWEYAGRAGLTSARYGELDDIAWDADNSGRSHIDSTALWNQDQKTYFQKLDDNGDGFHQVAQKRPNPYGLFDMLGNASEWVQDWYDAHYYEKSPAVDPQGPGTGTQRILRGWCWFNSPFAVRVSHRGAGDPTTNGNATGARCIMPVVP